MEVNRATMVLVNRRDQVRDVIPRWLEAKRSQGDFELLGLDGAASARIEQVKRVFDLLPLRLGEIGLVGLVFLGVVLFLTCLTKSIKLNRHESNEVLKQSKCDKNSTDHYPH